MTARAGRKPRWHRRKEARPGEIEAAALDLFVERGYAATKLEDVARRAGVTKGTMYLYFDSKEALFKAVIRGSMLPLFERGEALLEGHRGSAAELLQDFVRGWWQMIGESRVSGLPKLIMAESANFPELARFYHEEVVARGRRLFARVLERGIERGEFRAVDTAYALRVLSFSLLFAATWKHSLGRCVAEPFDFTRYLEAHVDLALNGLLVRPGAGGTGA
jgi:AcrR family transcriptional regulator